MTITRITSVHNPTIVDIRSLSRRKARREQGAFLVEGVRLLRDALAARVVPRLVVVCEELLGAESAPILAALAADAPAARIFSVDAPLMRSISDADTPQGAVAVVAIPKHVLQPLDARAALVLVIDGVRDPGNVGTLLRTAAAAGCTAVVCIEGSADPYAPKVVRAAMGAHFRLPLIADVAWDWLGPSLTPLPAVYGADGRADVSYDAVDWAVGAAVIVGNEDHGLSPEARSWCRGTVAIPMADGVESLNAAVSGAIILFEAVRQRRTP